MASRAETIRTAQRGVLLSRLFPAGPTRRRPFVADLTAEQRGQVIDAFTVLLEGVYAHLPLKRAMYGVDPVQRLRLLRQRADTLDSLSLHDELAGIVTGLRDAHTRYVGPIELEGRAAMLPFLIEAYGPPAARRYIVSKVVSDRSLIGHSRFFRPGVEIRWWNAVPMDRAVDRHADDETGGRPDARRARALESMTLRALRYSPPPDERWVEIGYLDRHGTERNLRVDWRVVAPRRAATAPSTGSVRAAGRPRSAVAARAYGIDPAAETHRRVKKLLFAPELWYADRHVPRAAKVVSATGEWLPTPLQDALAAKVVTVRGQRLGYLRLWSFDVADDEAYIQEVIRLLRQLPERGLIIDLRSNPGGLIWAAERLLQLFTPHKVQPNRFSMLATSITRAMAAAPQNQRELGAWLPSLIDSVATGEPYSLALPVTPVAACNNRGQVYGGPVVAIVDPNTYSAGDLFAAGFVDNRIGRLVSVGLATGAGGANVWSTDDVQGALLGTPHQQDALPAGIAYTVALRRATRTGGADGAAIEDIGVRGDNPYSMTERDLTGSNEDLIAYAGRIVLGLPRTQLTMIHPAADGEPLTLRTRGIDQIDVIVDGLHQPTRTISPRTSAQRTTRVELPAGWSGVEILGTAGGAVAQRRLLQP
jgi:hypothetical protein